MIKNDLAMESTQIQNVFSGAINQNIPKTPVNEVKFIVISNPQGKKIEKNFLIFYFF